MGKKQHRSAETQHAHYWSCPLTTTLVNIHLSSMDQSKPWYHMVPNLQSKRTTITAECQNQFIKDVAGAPSCPPDHQVGGEGGGGGGGGGQVCPMLPSPMTLYLNQEQLAAGLANCKTDSLQE